VKSASPAILAAEHLGNPLTEAALHGITRALASVGRAFICLDPSFTILHASHLLDRFLGEGASKALCGRPVSGPWISPMGVIPGTSLTSKMAENSVTFGFGKTFLRPKLFLDVM